MRFRSIFRHYWQFIWKYKWSQVILFTAFAIGQVINVAVIPVIFKLIIDTASNPPEDPAPVLYGLVGYLVLAYIGTNIVYRIGDYYIIRSQSKILEELYNYSLEKLHNQSYTFFTNSFSGSLIAKTKRFVSAFETLHDQFTYSIWFGIFSLLSSVVVLAYVAPLIAVAFVLWLVVYAVMITYLIKKQIPKSMANAAADTAVTAHYSDIITNFFTTKMFGTRKREEKDFTKTTDHQQKKRRIAWMQEGFWSKMFQGITINIFGVIFVLGAIMLWLEGSITVGTVALIPVYIITSFNTVWMISQNAIKVSSALTDADEMVEMFDREIEVKDPVEPEPVRMEKGEVRFDSVHFRYENNTKVFSNLHMEVASGEKVALVGHSGAGKTTVTKLLLRFLDIESGSITVDGQNIAHVKQDDLRKRIAYVPQEPLLFHRTIAENIAYAKPNATKKEIEAVAKKAHAHEFIKNLPNGYDTLVGERGVKLSGGERQRVAIARAMLKDAPIIMLDEATSALDSIVEEKIQDALWKLMKGKTTIVIAHRLSTIQQMDRIIVFDTGKIAEEGTHQELLKKKGVYAQLWNSQVGGFIGE